MPKRKTDLKKEGVEASAATSSPAPEQRKRGQFPVVGIGASAGGLEAFREMLEALPEKTGMAFIFVQHLDPTHGSVLPEIIARSTKIPVLEVKDGVRVEPDHLYIIAANTSIAVQDGTLRVIPRELTRGVHMPVNHLFRSLAEEQADMTVGVILSGTASDGTEGCSAIKAAGGLVFAQEPKSAKYASMPGNAIRAGCVDMVLPPKGLARELRRLSQHHYFMQPSHDDQNALIAPGREMNQLMEMVGRATGVDFSHYKQTTLQRRIRRRMFVHKVEALADYLKLIKSRPEELDELYKDILIHVTRFYRDEETFDALRTLVLPKIVTERSTDEGPVRIWVPGCSTGEEVYSIAMLVQEFLWESVKTTGKDVSGRPVQIFATDVSDLALDRARAGSYSETAVADIPPDKLRRFFVRADGGYQANKLLRDMCVFAKQNVVKDPPFSNLDLISCRNLLIYFSSVLQERAISAFHYALKPDGFLMLGNSETPGALSDHFTLLDKKHKIYQKKRTGSRMMTFFTPAEYGQRKAPSAASPKRQPPELTVEREVERVLMKRFVPPSVVVNQDLEIVQFRGRTGPYLEPAPGHPTFSLSKMAREGLLVDLREAINLVKKTGTPARRERVRVQSDGAAREVNFDVVPIRGADLQGRFYLIVFEEPGGPAAPPTRAAERKTTRAAKEREAREVKRLREQLQLLIEDHETTLEEYKSANEEALSSNEELQSTNEELETAKEELQSSNEELTTLNEEMANRNAELTQTGNDLVNLLDNVQIPIVIVNRDMVVRRFTPSARDLFNLLPGDVGRRLRELRPNLDLPDLDVLVREVMDLMATKEVEVRTTEGKWLLMRLRPYRTTDNRIDGAVISFQDIDAIKRQLDKTSEYAQALTENAREGILILDNGLRVVQANRAFYQKFQVSRQETEAQFVYDLGNGQWNIPLLRELLNKIISGNTRIDDYEVRHNFPSIGERIMMLNARRVEQPRGFLILLSIEDITEEKERERSVRDLATMIDLAHDAVIIRDMDGVISFWNRGAEEIYGWKRAEAVGKPMQDLLKTEFPAPREEIMEQLQKSGHWEGLLLKRDKEGRRKVIESRWVMREENGSPMVLQISTDITARQEAESRLRDLSARLIRVQDDERRRIARELHDSTGQKLAAVKMSLESGQREPQGENVITQRLPEAIDLVGQALQEIRTLAQLLHPPLLDETGLVSAAKYMVQGFADRSGIPAEFTAPKNFERLSPDTEIALFRILQEGLSNINRHSACKTAKIELRQNADKVVLEITDDGKGMPPGAIEKPLSVFGVGMMGMRQRLEQLGGKLEIASTPGKGTHIRAIAPRTRRTSED